jgi:Carboxypeptidase regulatory-like domain
MQHLDEGTLQAWLDVPRSGLDPSEVAHVERHLATCAACAQRAEALRRSSVRARSLLGVGQDPHEAPPPFEEVTARAAGSRGRRRVQRRRTAVAWAASVVLAIGVGWMTNDLFRTGVVIGPEGGRMAPARQPVADNATEPAPAPPPEEQARSAESSSGRVTMGSGAQPSPSAAPSAADRAAFAPAAPPQAAVADAAPSRAPVAAKALKGAVGEPLAPSAADADAGAQLASPADAGAVADHVAAAPEPAAARAQAAAPEPAAAPSPAPVVVTGRVVDEAGKPISAAQVFVADKDVGVLSKPDGSYSLSLPTSDSTRFDVTVQRIGFGEQTRSLTGRGGDSLAADFHLQEKALQLQEAVVTGDAPTAQRRATGGAALAAPVWSPSTRAAAESALGQTLRTAPALDVLSVELADSGTPERTRIARVRQDLGDGRVLTLVEGPSDASRDGWPVETNGSVESTRIGRLLITGTAPVAADSLSVILGGVR